MKKITNKNNLILGIIFAVLTSGVFLACSSAYMNDEFASIDTKSKSDEFYAKINTDEFKDYIKSLQEFTNVVSEYNSKLDKSELKELSEITSLYKADTKSHSAMLEAKMNQLYTQSEIAELSKLYSDLSESAIVLKKSGLLDNLSKEESAKLIKIMATELPIFKKVMPKRIVRTRGVSESECIADCAATRDEAIEIAAITAMCGIGVALVTCLATGGWGSALGLMNAFAAAHLGDVAIENAQNAYERCIKYC